MLQLDEDLLGLPDAVLVGAVDVGGGHLALLGVDEGLSLLVLGQAGDLGEGGVGHSLVGLGDPGVLLVVDGEVGVGGGGNGSGSGVVGHGGHGGGGGGSGVAEGVVVALGGGHAGGQEVLGGGGGGGHQAEKDKGVLGNKVRRKLRLHLQ